MSIDLYTTPPGTRNRPTFCALDELAGIVNYGDRISAGGFHFSRLPLALCRAVADRGLRDLHYICWGGSLALEILLEGGTIGSIALCFNSLDVFGLSPRFRKAVESGEIPMQDLTDTVLMEGHRAAQYGMSSMSFVLPIGSDLLDRTTLGTVHPDPLTEKPIGVAEAIPLDAMLLHAQRADEDGNVEIQGARNLDLTAAFAACNVLVTVEEIVPRGTFQQPGAPRAFILPRTFVRAIAVARYGAYPTSCLPYYPADYRELARVTSSDSIDLQTPPEPRTDFLAAAATIPPAEVTGPALLKHRSDPEAEESDATVDEIMVSWLANQYDNDSVCSVGSFSPLAFVSYLLSKKKHAPDLVIMSFNGGLIDIGNRPMAMMLAEPLDFQTAVLHCGGDDSFHWYYQRGLITHEVVTSAQIDKQCQTNNFEVRSPSGKRIRLPGQGGMADVANMHQHFMLYLTRHSRLTMVEQVDTVSAARGLLTDEERGNAGFQPGLIRLITNLGVFGFDEGARELVLASLHPGVTLEEVRDNTGFELRVSDNLATTEVPSAADLKMIRTDIDPLGMRRLEFVAGKERGPLLLEVIESEEAAAAAITGTPIGVKSMTSEEQRTS
jgi:glutaconate CoA-transferase, subunit A